MYRGMVIYAKKISIILISVGLLALFGISCTHEESIDDKSKEDITKLDLETSFAEIMERERSDPKDKVEPEIEKKDPDPKPKDDPPPDPVAQPPAAKSFLFKKISMPGSDVIRRGNPALASGNVTCNSEEGSCPIEDIFISTTDISTDSAPESWQPDGLMLASPDGLKDEGFRIYREGLDVNSPKSFFMFGYTWGGCMGDVNGDGYQDIVAIMRKGPHRLYLNRGISEPGIFDDVTDTNFEQFDIFGNNMPTKLSAIIEGHAVRPQQGVLIGDLSGKNRDCATAGVGSTEWEKYVTGIYNTTANRCAIGDFNNDGLGDVVIGHQSVITTMMLGGVVCPITPARAIQVYMSDRDNPGHLKDRSWSDGVITSSNVNTRIGDVSIADVNRDGFQDIMIAVGSKNGADSGVASQQDLLLNDGRGKFRPPVKFGNNSANAIRYFEAAGKYYVLVVKMVMPHQIFEISTVNGVPQFTDVSASVFGPNGGDWWKITNSVTGLKGSVSDGEICDLSGDGLPDLIIGASSDVHLYLSSTVDGRYKLTRRDDRIIGDNTKASIHDVSCADVNKDGRMDVVASFTGLAPRVLLNNGDGTFGSKELMPTFSDMDSGSSVKDADGDGAADILTPGFRNFNSLSSVRRMLGNQLYLFNKGTGRYDDWSSKVDNPKLDNIKACIAEGRGDDMFCDIPDSCMARCASACGAGYNDKCMDACSQHELWKNEGALTLMQEYCTCCASKRGDPNILSCGATNWSASYCSMVDANLPLDFCASAPSFTDVKWQKIFTAIYKIPSSMQDGKTAPVVKGWGWNKVEESSKISPIAFGGNNYLFVLNTFQPPDLLKFDKGSGRFIAVDAAKLPCDTRTSRMSSFVSDIDGDDLSDILFTSRTGSIVTWINTSDIAGKDLFEAMPYKWNMPQGTERTYEIKDLSLHPKSGKKAFIAKIANNKDPSVLKKGHKLALMEFDGDSFESSWIKDESGNEFLAQCEDHKNNTVGVCKPYRLSCDGKVSAADAIPGAMSDFVAADFDGDGYDDIVVGFTKMTGVLLCENNGYQSRFPHLFLRRGGEERTYFVDVAKEHLFYDLHSSKDGRFKNRNGFMQIMALAPADLDDDGDIDLVITDFDGPVYLENQGAECWQSKDSPCLVDKTFEYFGTADTFDGLYGAKNYAGEIFDFDGDGRLDYYLHTAMENILYKLVTKE